MLALPMAHLWSAGLLPLHEGSPRHFRWRDGERCRRQNAGDCRFEGLLVSWASIGARPRSTWKLRVRHWREPAYQRDPADLIPSETTRMDIIPGQLCGHSPWTTTPRWSVIRPPLTDTPGSPPEWVRSTTSTSFSITTYGIEGCSLIRLPFTWPAVGSGRCSIRPPRSTCSHYRRRSSVHQGDRWGTACRLNYPQARGRRPPGLSSEAVPGGERRDPEQDEMMRSLPASERGATLNLLRIYLSLASAHRCGGRVDRVDGAVQGAEVHDSVRQSVRADA